MNEPIYSSCKEARDRSDRLRRLRNLANLSRKFLCEHSGININTYIGYEVGRYGGLTKKGAEKLIEFLETKGVYSSLEWLMDGVGKAPQVVTDPKQITETDHAQSPQSFSEEQKINDEILLFKQHYEKSVHYQLVDDAMEPLYTIGSDVAGVPFTGKAIKNIIGTNCIIQTKNKEILVRNLREGRTKNTYVLTAINPLTNIKNPVIYDIELLFAAEIIWYRKKFTS